MQELKLKSKLIKAYDYREVDVSRFALPLSTDPKRYERDLFNFRKLFATKEEAEDVMSQDIVTLSCSSENPKFTKKSLTVRVGLGLYSKEFETKIVGMKKGETKSVTVGDDAVEVSVEKIVREIVPELTDELAAKSGIEGIKTVEDAKTYCRFKQYDEEVEDPADDAFAYLAQETLKKSDFELDEEELETARKMMVRSMDGHRLFSGKRFAEVTDEEFSAAFGFSKADMIKNMEQTGESTVKTALMGQALTTLYDKDYEAYLKKRAVAKEVSVDEIRKEEPEIEYIITAYSEFCMDEFEKYAIRKMKEVGECKHLSAQSS